MRHSAPTAAKGSGRGAITLLGVVGIAVAMVLLTRSRPAVQPFDPRSARADGANALVLLLEKFGASVTITAQVPDVATNERLLVLTDRLNDEQRQDLLSFADDGGVAVVADPSSTLHGADLDTARALADVTVNATSARDEAALESNVLRGKCTIGALGDLRGLLAPAGRLFKVPEGALRCFTNTGVDNPGRSFVVVREVGDGLVIGLGDNQLLTNRYLRYADNSGLAVALLAPNPRSAVRVILGDNAVPAPADIGSGDKTLSDLVRPGVWMALVQLALAFVVFAGVRAASGSRVLSEPEVTPIAGNELVLATGNLMQRAHHFERAGWLLRSEAYHQLCREYATPAGIPIDRLGHVVAQRSEVSAEMVTELLTREIDSQDDLRVLSLQLQSLRRATVTRPLSLSEQP